MNINDKINKLPQKQRAEFLGILKDVLNDRGWCAEHGIRDYANLPTSDVELAKERLYQELTAVGYL